MFKKPAMLCFISFFHNCSKVFCIVTKIVGILTKLAGTAIFGSTIFIFTKDGIQSKWGGNYDQIFFFNSIFSAVDKYPKLCTATL